MSIFKSGKLTKSQFISKLTGLIIYLLFFGFTWGVQFPGDGFYSDGETLDFGALHTIFNIISIIGSVAYLVVIFYKSLDDDLSCDFEEGGSSKSYISMGIVGILLGILVLSSLVYSECKVIYNKSIGYQNSYNQVSQEKETYYDNMWKSYKLKDKIVIDNKETFIEITKIIMDGRKDGTSLAWKWTQENQPVPYSEFSAFYKDLSNYVESRRDGFQALEVKAQKIAMENNTMLQSLPNNIYNKLLKCPLIDYKKSFSSQKTQSTFKSGLEEI